MIWEILITLLWLFAMASCLNAALGRWVYFRVLSIKEWVDAKLLQASE